MKLRKPLKNPADRMYSSTTMLVLGASGSGKTTLASTVGSLSGEQCELLVIDNDNGSGGIRMKNPALIPESFSDYVNIINAVKRAVMSQEKPPYTMSFAGHEFTFNGVMIDTLNAVQDIVRAEIKGGYLASKQIRIQDYGRMLDNLTGLILSLRELASIKPFHFVVTAQITPDKVTISGGENDEASYQWKPSLSGSISSKLPEYFDMVLTTYVAPRTGKHVVFCGDTITDRGTFIGKMRYGHLTSGSFGSVLPMENVTWASILKLHGVDVDSPSEIGALDTLAEVAVHWSNDSAKRDLVSQALSKLGVTISEALELSECSSWDELEKKGITGADFIAKAKEAKSE